MAIVAAGADDLMMQVETLMRVHSTRNWNDGHRFGQYTKMEQWVCIYLARRTDVQERQKIALTRPVWGLLTLAPIIQPWLLMM